MKIGFGKIGCAHRLCVQIAITIMSVMATVSCSEFRSDNEGPAGEFIPVTFTMSTPAGEAVPYAATRVHDEAEWTINKLVLYVYAVDEQGEGTFLRRYATDAAGDEAINIVSNGAGKYTFTLRAPVGDLNAKRRFVFVANDAFATPEVGESQDELQSKIATVAVSEGNAADVLAAEGTGIAMTGIAKSSSNDVVTITPGVKCEVTLRRIVARVDVQNNTPNLVIKSIQLENAAPKGYLFEHEPVEAADASYVGMQMNSSVALGDSYDDQTDLKKVFYLYERTNAEGEGNSAQVRIAYTINNSNGEVVVPFRKTSDDMAFVDVKRNTLYTIVLGDGEPVVTNEVKFTLNVEEWNLVDMDEPVDPDEDAQAKLNAALKVNMFTPFDVKEVDLKEKKIVSFYDKLAVSAEDCPMTSYFSIADIGASLNETFTDEHGNFYRLPTQGEAMLLLPLFTEEDRREDIDPGTANGMYHPTWNDNYKYNTDYSQIVTSEFTETVYLKNTADGKLDQTDHGADENYKLVGTSQMALGPLTDEIFRQSNSSMYNVHPVYAYRFKGTSQYSAYRWETCRISDNPQERYFSIKIKALDAEDVDMTIGKIANEAFWKNGYIEYRFPMCGYYSGDPSASEIIERGLYTRFWTSSVNADNNFNGCFAFGAGDAAVNWLEDEDYRFPIRFVRVTE